MTRKLLILDDDELICAYVRRIAEDLGYHVRVSSAADRFREYFWADRPDDIVLDLQLGSSDGIEILRFLSAQAYRGRITFLSGFDNRTLASARDLALSLGLTAGEALHKPVRAPDLRAALAMPEASASDITAASLSAGIRNNELVLEYQPIIDCATGSVAGLEALVRWQRPGALRVPPDQFIPVAEADPDLMDMLTFAIASRAAQDWPVLQAASFDGFVALNISAQNLRRLDFPERLAGLLQDSGLPPGQVKLEITESAAMTNPLVTLDILLRLRLRGFQLAVDDFGTGYSSLSMLRRLPYSELKVDRSFVKDMNVSRDALAIVKAVIALARSMELSTVAEGVEDQGTLDNLIKLGASHAQGFGISRPLAVSKLVEWLAERPSSIQRGSKRSSSAS